MTIGILFMGKRRRHIITSKPTTLVAITALGLLTACGGGSGNRTSPSANISANAPVQLGGASATQTTSTSVLGPLDETTVRRAIELYRVLEKACQGTLPTRGRRPER